jgi:ammonia channel protein AmtB
MNAGNTVWALVSAGLVMVMVPGLVPFYGGQVSSRNVLVMLQQNIFALGLISILTSSEKPSLLFAGLSPAGTKTLSSRPELAGGR